MKKLFRISLLMAVVCLAVPVYADGDLSTGNKTCTQNCPGLYDGTSANQTVTVEEKQDESKIVEIYSTIFQRISDLFD